MISQDPDAEGCGALPETAKEHDAVECAVATETLQPITLSLHEKIDLTQRLLMVRQMVLRRFGPERNTGDAC